MGSLGISMKRCNALAGFAVLVVLVAGCAKQAVSQTPVAAPACAVLDPDIGAQYIGECRDGLANGQGIGTGRDHYEGRFQDGLPHGEGRYAWGPTSEWPTQVYAGYHLRGNRTGFGVLSGDASLPQSAFIKDIGALENDRFVARGLLLDGALVTPCASVKECGSFLIVVDVDRIMPPDTGVHLTQNATWRLLTQILHNYDQMQANLSGCVAVEVLQAYAGRHPSHAVMDVGEIKVLLRSLEDRPVMLATFLECFKLTKLGGFRSDHSDQPYQPISLEELIPEINHLRVESRVSVTGTGKFKDGQFVLAATHGPGLPVQLGGLQVENTKPEPPGPACATQAARECQLTVQGVIQYVEGQKALVAEHLVDVGFVP